MAEPISTPAEFELKFAVWETSVKRAANFHTVPDLGTLYSQHSFR